MSQTPQLTLPCLVFLFSFALLGWNAAPGVTFHDGGEMALAAATAGVPHPPGMPTWTILASAFVRAGGFKDAARGTNLFSALCGALTLAFLSAAALSGMERANVARGVWSRISGAVAAPLILLHCQAFLEQSFATEQYTLMTAFLAGILILGLRLTKAAPAENNDGTLKSVGMGWMGLGLLAGLAVGNHLSQIALAPLLALWCMHGSWSRGAMMTAARRAGWVGLGFVLGFAVYFWVPLRSATEPLMDWGAVRSWERMMWALGRANWNHRSIAEAPVGFTSVWLQSFDFIGQLGVAGIACFLPGAACLARNGRGLLVWLLLMTVPYAFGLYWGHLHEAGKSLTYLRLYGVTDWHLPLYLAGALVGGVGIGCGMEGISAGRSTRAAAIAGGLAIALLFGTSMWSVRIHSLRGDESALRFVRDLRAGMEPDAVAAPANDNAGFMLAYDRYVLRAKDHDVVMIGARTLPGYVADAIKGDGRWAPEARARYLREVLPNPEIQPLRIAPIETERALTAAIYTDYALYDARVASYFAPAGLLFRLNATVMTVAEIKAAEEENQRAHPELFGRPEGRVNRFEAEARQTFHHNRGIYFSQLGMWNEAARAYALATDWEPRAAISWLQLGEALGELGRSEEAISAYENCLSAEPYQPLARNNLAILKITGGAKEEAVELWREELRLFPENAEARKNLARAKGKSAR